MPAFQDVNLCCGVQIIYGFEDTVTRISKWLNELEQHGHLALVEGKVTKTQPSYVRNMLPGMYIIFLDENQNDAFSKLLQKHGFKLAEGTPFRNPKMKNRTKVYMYTRINEFSWYEKFLTEKDKRIWQAN